MIDKGMADCVAIKVDEDWHEMPPQFLDEARRNLGGNPTNRQIIEWIRMTDVEIERVQPHFYIYS